MSYDPQSNLEYVNEYILNDDLLSQTSSANNYEQDMYNDDNESADFSQNNKPRFETQHTDPDCRSFTTKNNRRNVKITYYTTNMTPGRYIRDAVSGAYCKPYRVGRKVEDLFFKVAFTRGNTAGHSQHGETLFYSSPQEYEKHMCVKLPEETKKLWKDKFNKMILSMQ